MVTYQADSPSRMCDGSLDEAARMLDSSVVSSTAFDGSKSPRVHRYIPH
jgi:hypothetical protein